jgi:hypothetical protein
MHPYINSRVSQERMADLRRSADHGRLATQAAEASRASRAGRSGAPGRTAGIAPAAIRNRAGWTLVHLGLRLMSGSADG